MYRLSLVEVKNGRAQGSLGKAKESQKRSAGTEVHRQAHSNGLDPIQAALRRSHYLQCIGIMGMREKVQQGPGQRPHSLKSCLENSKWGGV